MKLYLAGPMTGLPKFNFPAFEEWATRLRAAGFEVLSPHESDPPDVQALAWASTTGDVSELPSHYSPVEIAALNVREVGACQGVALMDDWYRSSGATHEVATAARFRLPVAPVVMWEFVRVIGARYCFEATP